MVKAFILITTDARSSADVARQVLALPGVTEAYEVMGPYDIVAIVEVDELARITEVVSHGIRQIAGVATTVTCVTMP